MRKRQITHRSEWRDMHDLAGQIGHFIHPDAQNFMAYANYWGSSHHPQE
jgi:hypothetical protein